MSLLCDARHRIARHASGQHDLSFCFQFFLRAYKEHSIFWYVEIVRLWVLLFETDPVLQKTITWGYINIVFYSRIFPRTPFTNGRPSNNFFSVAVSFTQKIVCYATRNNALYITQSLVTFEVLHALADGVLSIQLAHWNLNQYFPVKHMKPSSTFRTIPISLHPHSAQFR